MLSLSSLVAGVVLSGGFAQAPEAGELPKGLDGRVLNLDFETGDLRDWKAEGKAFEAAHRGRCGGQAAQRQP